MDVTLVWRRIILHQVNVNLDLPYFHDQMPRLQFISSRDLLRLLFEGGH